MLNNNFLKKALICSIFCYSLLKPEFLKKNKKIKRLAILFTVTGLSISSFIYAYKNKNSINTWCKEFFKLKNSHSSNEISAATLENNENSKVDLIVANKQNEIFINENLINKETVIESNLTNNEEISSNSISKNEMQTKYKEEYKNKNITPLENVVLKPQKNNNDGFSWFRKN